MLQSDSITDGAPSPDPSLPTLPRLEAPGSVDSSTPAPPAKRKRGGNRKGSSNWKRREQNVLLDLLESTPKFPTKLDDWNAMCTTFNERTTAMGFPVREGKSLRKKWQVLMSSKGVEGEGLNEQEMRAKRIAQGEASIKRDTDSKRQRTAGAFSSASSSPLAPAPVAGSSLFASASSSSSSEPGAQQQPAPLTRESVAAAVRALRQLLASRQAEFERREYVWAQWRRLDMEEREKTRELLDALVQLDEDEGRAAAAAPAPAATATTQRKR